MSCLAKIICLLLVAAATRVSAQSSLAAATKSFDEEFSSQTKYLKTEFYKWTSQAKKSISRASAKIEELMNKEFPTDEDGISMKDEVIECYEEHRRQYKDAFQNLGKINKEALLLLEKCKSEAKECESRHTNQSLDETQAAWCVLEAEADLLHTVKQTQLNFEKVVKKLEAGFERCESFLRLAESHKFVNEEMAE